VDNENNVWMSVNGGLLKYNYSKPLKVFDSDTNISNVLPSILILKAMAGLQLMAAF